MNALNFLKHKSDVTFVYEDHSVKRAMDEFRVSGFTALPILTRDGHYAGTGNGRRRRRGGRAYNGDYGNGEGGRNFLYCRKAYR